jgi:putative membrane protein
MNKLSMPIEIPKSISTTTSRSTSDSSPVHIPQDLESDKEGPYSSNKSELVYQRTQELCGLLVGYAFALQYVPSHLLVYDVLTERHHLHGTRPLPQPPLSDLLPSAYLSSLRRTEARVRFAESHAPPASPDNVSTEESSRPGLRRRSTGPKPDGDGNEEEWELSDLRLKAEEAVEKLSKAVANSGEDLEFRQQLDQLNIPIPEQSSPSRPTKSHTSGQERRRKSNLCAPYPPNMPLALLKLMESYVIGLAEVPKEKGGWAEAKRERGLNLVKALSGHLGDAERLSSSTSFYSCSLR